ncbi:unnamed protein product [Danaus chrysippus]|uniref:(African queen) hypothetical protein n=1 Tax=Danaus chrysippus TaxID=151541 RepID=A0A8J2QE03_9NEOP|nr:unnamed protein product [Danaus chrysippus]
MDSRRPSWRGVSAPEVHGGGGGEAVEEALIAEGVFALAAICMRRATGGDSAKAITASAAAILRVSGSGAGVRGRGPVAARTGGRRQVDRGFISYRRIDCDGPDLAILHLVSRT